MADLFENPMGLDGFEFVEFASPTPGVLEPVFEMMGFTAVAKHRSKEVVLFAYFDRIEVWNKATYDNLLTDEPDDFSRLAEDVMGNQNEEDDESNEIS